LFQVFIKEKYDGDYFKFIMNDRKYIFSFLQKNEMEKIVKNEKLKIRLIRTKIIITFL